MCQNSSQNQNAIFHVLEFCICQHKETVLSVWIFLSLGEVETTFKNSPNPKRGYKATGEVWKLVPTNYVEKLYVQRCIYDIVDKHCFYDLFEKPDLISLQRKVKYRFKDDVTCKPPIF